jgi:hypothetical protein
LSVPSLLIKAAISYAALKRSFTGFSQLLLFILSANVFLTGGSGTTIRHNTQITHITQNDTPHSKHSTQNYNNKGHTTHNVYNENTLTTTTNTEPRREKTRCCILGSHNGAYEEFCLLGCDAVCLGQKFSYISEERTASIFRVEA